MPWRDPGPRVWHRSVKLAYAEGMISMATLEEIHQQKHSLALYCGACERWDTADLDALIRRGWGSRQVVDTRFRCRDCGDVAEKQLRPPVPAVTRAAAYIQPIVPRPAHPVPTPDPGAGI